MSDLKGKWRSFTGASKGIGAAIAKGLERGRRRGGGELCLQPRPDAEGVVADIAAKGGKAIAVKGDAVAKVRRCRAAVR